MRTVVMALAVSALSACSLYFSEKPTQIQPVHDGGPGSYDGDITDLDAGELDGGSAPDAGIGCGEDAGTDLDAGWAVDATWPVDATAPVDATWPVDAVWQVDAAWQGDAAWPDTPDASPAPDAYQALGAD